MESTLVELLSQYGYIAIFITVAIDHTGIPVPLVVFSMLAITLDLNIHYVILISFIASMISDLVLYYLGSTILKRLHRSQADKLNQVAKINKDLVVVAGRYYPIIGRYMAAYWGAVNFELQRFVYLSLLGNLLTVLVFGYSIYYVGNKYFAEFLLDKQNALIITLIILVLSITPTVVQWFFKRR